MLYRSINLDGQPMVVCEKGWWLTYYSRAHFRSFFGWRWYPIGDWWWITSPGFQKKRPNWWIFWLLEFDVCLYQRYFTNQNCPESIYQERFPSAIGCPETPVDTVNILLFTEFHTMLGGCLGFLPSTVSMGIPQVSHYSSIELPIDITPSNLNIYTPNSHIFEGSCLLQSIISAIYLKFLVL